MILFASNTKQLNSSSRVSNTTTTIVIAVIIIIVIMKTIPTAQRLQEDPDSVALATAPFDPRFPNANQTKNCWQNYVDYHMCVAARGADYDPCGYFKRIYKILCPQAWVERWDELREEGRFAADLTPPSINKLKEMAGHE